MIIRRIRPELKRCASCDALLNYKISDIKEEYKNGVYNNYIICKNCGYKMVRTFQL